jgi:hypothetical protein
MERRTPDDFRAGIDARQVDQHELSGTAHVPDSDEIVRFGVEAAERLTAGHHYADWIKVGRAVVVGRTEAMREAHVNRPEGRGYAAALHRWLVHTGLVRVIGDTGARSRLLDLVDHHDQVEAWRKTLPSNKQLELNHPNTIWRHWKRSTVVPAPNKQPKPSPVAKLKESVAILEEENQRLKGLNGGNAFTSKDRPADVVRILVSTFSRHKLAEIRSLLGKEISGDPPPSTSSRGSNPKSRAGASAS